MQITIRPDLVGPLEEQSAAEDRSATKIVNRILLEYLSDSGHLTEIPEVRYTVNSKPKKEKS